MTLTVEDGTGLATADAYVSLVDFRAYHVKFGNTTVTALTDAATEILILKATRYIDATYGQQFEGQRISAAQSLQAPRYPVYHSDGWLLDVDQQLVILANACNELGLRAYSEDIYPDLDTGAEISSESNSVGSISSSVTYVSGMKPVKKYRLVDDAMAELISSGASGEVCRS